MRKVYYLTTFTLLLFLLSCSTSSQQDELERNFQNPPQSSKPRTWMHAMSGNMSKEGITKDLESMADVGLGGLLLFNITQGIPLGNIVYNSPEHHEILTHAAAEAERLGLSFGVHNCDGWSSSGGPWITPENSIKMVVWSEQVIQGSDKLSIQLKEPTKREGFYKDIAVIAYPSLPTEITENQQKPILSSSDKSIDNNLINDGLLDQTTRLGMIAKNKPWIQFSYSKPFTARAAFVLHTERFGAGEIQISNDGKNFTSAFTLKGVRTGKGEWAMNDHFEPITAKHFRFVFNMPMNLKEINLRATYLYDNPMGRTAMARSEYKDLGSIGNPEENMLIKKSSIINLSAMMDETGKLTTSLPEGYWTILRFGYTSTGAFNNPASNEGRGLESDKLSKKATKIHFNAFAKKVIDNAKTLAPNAMQYIEIDSYEMGGQNWTANFDSIFSTNKKYDLIPLLPVYAGRFIDDAESTEAILWDLRDEICTLMTKNYFGYFTELCHQNGVISYIEPYGFGPVNELEVGGQTDIPMGEFWMNRDMPMVPPAVSSAHIYGKQVISAESFTSTPEINWKGHPAMAKPSGDKAWARGINEFMFHRFAHQANPNVEPGMTMNRWGFHMDRTQTWWKSAGAAWFKYVARGSYMLRQGVPVSDLLVFVGETSPNGTFTNEDLKKNMPIGTNFDNVNADVLLHRISIKNKQLVLPEGTEYKALALKNNVYASLELVNKLHKMAQQGVLIIGNPPQKLAGYGHTNQDIQLFNKLVAEIWSSPTTFTNNNWQDVFNQQNITPDLVIEGYPHLEFAHRKTTQHDIYFLYNPDSVAKTYQCTFRVDGKIPELWNAENGTIQKLGNFYAHDGKTHVSIPLQREGAVFVVFRENNQNIQPIKSISSQSTKENIWATITEKHQLEFLATQNDTYTITQNNNAVKEVNVSSIPQKISVDGEWKISFNKQGGYETDTVLSELMDWRDIKNDGIQHYSGTALYHKIIEVPNNYVDKNTQLTLNLGNVSIVAQVYINGKDLGVLWKKPFSIDITSAVKAGDNEIVLAVTNQWSNRLIGEERYPANDDEYKLEGARPENKMPQWYINNQPRPRGKRSTFTTAPFYKASDPLISSGLLGPVHISAAQKIRISN